jgi:hypothetical protein
MLVVLGGFGLGLRLLAAETMEVSTIAQSCRSIATPWRSPGDGRAFPKHW